MLPHTCSVATTAQYCLVRFIHRADSLAAGAVSCRLMSSTFKNVPPDLACRVFRQDRQLWTCVRRSVYEYKVQSSLSDLKVDLNGGLLIWYEKSLPPWTGCQ